jgi:type IV pilus assembly protein PilM
MPILSDRELASAIYWEAEQYIPIPLTNVSLAWSILKKPLKAAPGEKMEVLMVGAPTLIAKKYQKIIEMAGFSINSMETEILSAVRSLTLNPANSAATPTIIVSIGAISTSLATVAGPSLIFTYSMPLGGTAINRAISADFGLTHVQAEEYKRTYGISNGPLGQRIGKATEPIVSSILSEIKKAVVYYSQKYKDSKIEQIVLSGGTAKLPGIGAYFSQNLGIETVTANPWKLLSGQNLPKEILENGPDYTIAMGLALKDYVR